MKDPDQYKPTSPTLGAWLFLTSKRRFLDAAVAHAAWVNLMADNLKKSYLAGRYEPITNETRTLENQRLETLRRQFRSSLLQMLLVSLLVLFLGAAFGVVGLSLHLSLARVLGFLGTFLIGWAALFELGGPGLASWKGITLSEQTHPRVFQALFIPGAFFLLFSILL